jgi:hypothetical protein
MYWFLAVAILGATLFQHSGTYLRLESAPIVDAPLNATEVGLAIFDLQVSSSGLFPVVSSHQDESH